MTRELCEGQPDGEPSCDEKISYWINRYRQAVDELVAVRAELANQEAVMVAADRIYAAYEAMLAGKDLGRLAEWTFERDV